jgi:two-component sensor histidine kinase
VAARAARLVQALRSKLGDPLQECRHRLRDAVDAIEEGCVMQNASVSAIPASEDHLLLRELSHRVQNEFASAMAQVTLMAAQSCSDDVRKALAAVRERLYRCAQIHRVLDIPDDDSLVDASSHLQVLCASISRARLEDQRVALILDTQPVTLRARQSWRLNMIVAELITNAVRHAFAGGPGSIRVAFSRSGPIVECCISDNGSASRRAKPGRGLGIVAALSESLGGKTVQRFGPHGSVSVIAFPACNSSDNDSFRDGDMSARYIARATT